jgi:hypothetical protein
VFSKRPFATESVAELLVEKERGRTARSERVHEAPGMGLLVRRASGHPSLGPQQMGVQARSSPAKSRNPISDLEHSV